MKHSIHINTKQNGAALIVSLMILLVLTIIGVSALANTSLEERMAHNYQHATIAFQGAESAISRVINAGDAGGAGQFDNPFYDADNDPLITALNAGLNDTSTVITANLDPNGHLANTALNTSATVIYRNTGSCPEMSMGEIICFYFDIDATANIAATATQAKHVQGVARPAPGGAG
ncbi:pilus assembly PilX family protein [Kaarinaea lacus]